MQRRHMGRPGTPVFPPDWQKDHALVIDKVLDCKIQIGPAGTQPVFDPGSGTTKTRPVDPVYDGDAALAPVSSSDGRRVDAADQVVLVRSYEITLPVDVAGLRKSHRVLIVESPDAMLTGQLLTVDSIERGDRRFSRVLYATLKE